MTVEDRPAIERLAMRVAGDAVPASQILETSPLGE
jgi:hypothetical protein